MRRADVNALMERLRSSYGEDSAKRLERAADEIKGLDTRYSDDALHQVFMGNRDSAVAAMKPGDFEKYSVPLPERGREPYDTFDNHSGLSLEQYLDYLNTLDKHGGLLDAPYLNLAHDDPYAEIPRIAAHEGRHRMRAMAHAGHETGLVQLRPTRRLAEHLAHGPTYETAWRTPEEKRQALLDHLSLYDNHVEPEYRGPKDGSPYGGTPKRPPVKLPEPFASGGPIRERIHRPAWEMKGKVYKPEGAPKYANMGDSYVHSDAVDEMLRQGVSEQDVDDAIAAWPYTGRMARYWQGEKDWPSPLKDGYLTTTGRFIDRNTAKDIARGAGQIQEDPFHPYLDSVEMSDYADDRYESVPGKPGHVLIPGHGHFEARPIPEIEGAKRAYMGKRFGDPHKADIDHFTPFDEATAKKIAQAYEEMAHAPHDPRVKRSYEAMIDETLDQYHSLKNAGYDFHFMRDGEEDPYAASPALGYLDAHKGHLTVFPTDQGYGMSSVFDEDENPLLKRVGKVGDLDNATANDAFRAVHDMYGHFGPGNPFFRHKGEERAWEAHSRMYSDDAAPAMTAETRGQNNWMNFGPHAEHNAKASGANTIYAEQKAGLMPEWSWRRHKRADGGPAEFAYGGPVIKQLRQAAKTPGVKMKLHPLQPNEQAVQLWDHEGPEVWLEWIESQRKGAGAEAMRKLTEEADRTNTALRLYPDDNGSGKLHDYYRQFGFETDPHGGENWERPPRQKRADGGKVDAPELNEIGLFSRALEETKKLKQPKGKLSDVLRYLKGRGVKDTEIKALKLDKDRPDEILTREELAERIRSRRLNLKAQVRSEKAAKDWKDKLRELDYKVGNTHPEAPEYAAAADAYLAHSKARPTPPSEQYRGYTRKGGDNYTEQILHMPPRELGMEYGLFTKGRPGSHTWYNSKEEADKAAAAMEQPGMEKLRETYEVRAVPKTEDPLYSSGHWTDIPNTLLHMRTKERTTPEGLKVHYGEELQSDWGQAGHKEGFRHPDYERLRQEADAAHMKAWNAKADFSSYAQRLRDAYMKDHPYPNDGPYSNEKRQALDAWEERFAQHRDADPEWNRLFAEQRAAERASEEATWVHRTVMAKSGSPNPGPYVTDTHDWVDLGLKKHLLDAHKGGFDAVAWAPGEENADHYNQRLKNIKTLEWHEPEVDDDDGELRGYLEVRDHKGNLIHDDYHAPDQLPEVIGKDNARALLEAPLENDRRSNRFTRRLDFPEGMTLGGEGMQKFYDGIVKSRLRKLVRGLDPAADVEWSPVSAEPGGYHYDPENGRAPNAPTYRDAHLVRITPTMRDKLKYGLEEFHYGGEVERHGFTRGGSAHYMTEENDVAGPGGMDPSYRYVDPHFNAGLLRMPRPWNNIREDSMLQYPGVNWDIGKPAINEWGRRQRPTYDEGGAVDREHFLEGGFADNSRPGASASDFANTVGISLGTLNQAVYGQMPGVGNDVSFGGGYGMGPSYNASGQYSGIGGRYVAPAKTPQAPHAAGNPADAAGAGGGSQPGSVHEALGFAKAPSQPQETTEQTMAKKAQDAAANDPTGFGGLAGGTKALVGFAQAGLGMKPGEDKTTPSDSAFGMSQDQVNQTNQRSWDNSGLAPQRPTSFTPPEASMPVAQSLGWITPQQGVERFVQNGIAPNTAAGYVSRLQTESGHSMYDGGMMLDPKAAGDVVGRKVKSTGYENNGDYSAWGAAQFRGPRAEAMMNDVSDWDTNYLGQIDHIAKTLREQGVDPDKYDDPVSAYRDFTVNYERPLAKHQQLAIGGQRATQLASAYNDMGGDTQVAGPGVGSGAPAGSYSPPSDRDSAYGVPEGTRWAPPVSAPAPVDSYVAPQRPVSVTPDTAYGAPDAVRSWANPQSTLGVTPGFEAPSFDAGIQRGVPLANITPPPRAPMDPAARDYRAPGYRDDAYATPDRVGGYDPLSSVRAPNQPDPITFRKVATERVPGQTEQQAPTYQRAGYHDSVYSAPVNQRMGWHDSVYDAPAEPTNVRAPYHDTVYNAPVEQRSPYHDSVYDAPAAPVYQRAPYHDSVYSSPTAPAPLPNERPHTPTPAWAYQGPDPANRSAPINPASPRGIPQAVMNAAGLGDASPRQVQAYMNALGLGDAPGAADLVRGHPVSSADTTPGYHIPGQPYDSTYGTREHPLSAADMAAAGLGDDQSFSKKYLGFRSNGEVDNDLRPYQDPKTGQWVDPSFSSTVPGKIAYGLLGLGITALNPAAGLVYGATALAGKNPMINGGDRLANRFGYEAHTPTDQPTERKSLWSTLTSPQGTSSTPGFQGYGTGNLGTLNGNSGGNGYDATRYSLAPVANPEKTASKKKAEAEPEEVLPDDWDAMAPWQQEIWRGAHHG